MFLVLVIAPDGIRAQVGQLNHARQAAVHEQRGFDDPVPLWNPAFSFVKPAGELCQFFATVSLLS